MPFKTTKEVLISEIIAEMDYVWGDEGLGGEVAEYEWLLATYGITEEEDVKWQIILEHWMGELREEDESDAELMEFINDDDAVIAFLTNFLEKYQTSSQVYPRK